MSRVLLRRRSRELKPLDNYVYILKCADGSLYTGWTNDLKRRFAAHSAGKGAKYTRLRLPVALAYCEKWATKELAMKREYEIKHMKRSEKIRIIENSEMPKEFLEEIMGL